MMSTIRDNPQSLFRPQSISQLPNLHTSYEVNQVILHLTMKGNEPFNMMYYYITLKVQIFNISLTWIKAKNKEGWNIRTKV